MSEENPYRSPPNNDSSPPEVPRSEPLYGRLITLAKFGESIDAHLFRNELESQGVRAAVTNESASMLGATLAGQTSIFTIDVMIMESDAEAGMEIKKRWEETRSGANSEGVSEDWVCECGETVDAGFEICWNCDSPFVAKLSE